MVQQKKDKRIESFVGELIKAELETQVSRLLKKAKKRTERERPKLNQFLQLQYSRDDGFIEAEYSDPHPDEGIKKGKMEAGARGFDNGIINHDRFTFGFVLDLKGAGVGRRRHIPPKLPGGYLGSIYLYNF